MILLQLFFILTSLLWSWMDTHNRAILLFLNNVEKKMNILLSYYCKSHHRTSDWVIFMCLIPWIPQILVSAQCLKGWRFQWDDRESMILPLKLKEFQVCCFPCFTFIWWPLLTKIFRSIVIRLNSIIFKVLVVAEYTTNFFNF